MLIRKPVPEDAIFAVVPTPGWYGDYVSVYGSYTDPKKAWSHARREGNCRVLIGCDSPKGSVLGAGVVADMVGSGFWPVLDLS